MLPDKEILSRALNAGWKYSPHGEEDVQDGWFLWEGPNGEEYYSQSNGVYPVIPGPVRALFGEER